MSIWHICICTFVYFTLCYARQQWIVFLFITVRRSTQKCILNIFDYCMWFGIKHKQAHAVQVRDMYMLCIAMMDGLSHTCLLFNGNTLLWHWLHDCIYMNGWLYEWMTIWVDDCMTLWFYDRLYDSINLYLYDFINGGLYKWIWVWHYYSIALRLYDSMTVWLWHYNCMSVWLYDTMTLWLWLYQSMTLWHYDCMTDCMTLTVWLYDCVTVWLYDCITGWLTKEGRGYRSSWSVFFYRMSPVGRETRPTPCEPNR